MKYITLILISIGLLASCGKNNDSDENFQTLGKPDIPPGDSIDVNADNVFDFVIGYKEFATDDLPSSAGSIIGLVRPLNQNQMLYREQEGYLFLEINDTIRKNFNTNSDWEGFEADLISIDRDYQNWDKTWTILSEEKIYYFLVYKLALNNSEEIGWLSLEFDKITGVISIKDGDISNNEELIIHKKGITG